jgi:hypothetical protein
MILRTNFGGSMLFIKTSEVKDFAQKWLGGGVQGFRSKIGVVKDFAQKIGGQRFCTKTGGQ